MRRLLSLFVVVLTLTACQMTLEESLSSNESFSETSFSVSSNNNVFVVDSSASSITLSGDLAGKSLYYAVVNTTEKRISHEFVSCISSSSDRAALSSVKEVVEDSDDCQAEEVQFKHYEDDFHPEFEASSSRAALDTVSGRVENLSLKKGLTSKKIYTVDEFSAYHEKTATLWAENEICNVWVVDDDAYISSSSLKEEIAGIYAEKFASACPFVYEIFGKESDMLYTSTSGFKQSMKELSETGTKINIVIYDLFNDGIGGDTLGFFSSMDYYMNGLKFRNLTVSHSNEGKYIYIDSYFAQRFLDYTVSTLVHEFQHMINFSVKAMNGLACDQNFNEMLSMLCEEFLQETLGISDEFSPKNRVYTFIQKYYRAGIREYDNTLQSYANAYAFGSWLTREFGGKALIKEMMRNGKSNNDCIASAVNSLNGTDYSFNLLFKHFVKACFDQNCYSPRIFDNDQISELASSYGIFLKNFGKLPSEENAVTLNISSVSGAAKSGVLVYVYVK